MFSGEGYVPCFIFYSRVYSMFWLYYLNIYTFKCCTDHTSSHTNAYMCTQIGMHVVLSQVIPNSPGLSKTTSRCAQLARIPVRQTRAWTHCNASTRTHTRARPHTSMHMSSKCWKKRSFLLFSFRSYFTLPLCVILTISDRRILLSPKLWASCLMMFYHTFGIVFTFPCMFKKDEKKTPYFRMVVSVKGAIDMLSSQLPPSPSVSLPLFSSSLPLFKILHFH